MLLRKSLARLTQTIAVETPTPNRSAACRADILPAAVLITRLRRSGLYA